MGYSGADYAASASTVAQVGVAGAAATGGLSLGAAFIISGLVQLGGSILGSMTAKRPPKSIEERNYEAIVDYYSDLGEKAKITRQIASVYTGKPVSDYGGSIGFRDALEIMKAKGFDFGELNDVVNGVDTVGGTITIKPGGATQTDLGRGIAPSDEEVKAYTDVVKGGDIAKTGPAMAGIVQGMAGRMETSPLRFEHAGGEVSRTATPTKAEFGGFGKDDYQSLYNRGIITEDEYRVLRMPLPSRGAAAMKIYDRIYGQQKSVGSRGEPVSKYGSTPQQYGENMDKKKSGITTKSMLDSGNDRDKIDIVGG